MVGTLGFFFLTKPVSKHHFVYGITEYCPQILKGIVNLFLRNRHGSYYPQLKFLLADGAYNKQKENSPRFSIPCIDPLEMDGFELARKLQLLTFSEDTFYSLLLLLSNVLLLSRIKNYGMWRVRE